MEASYLPLRTCAMLQNINDNDTRELNQSVLAEMQRALSAFARTLHQLGYEQQAAFNDVFPEALKKATADIRQPLQKLKSDDPGIAQLIASYICKITFLSAACKSVGRYDCFQDVQHECFKNLIDLPLPYGVVRSQMQDMLEMWRLEIRSRLTLEPYKQSLAS